jgi:peptidoglycan/LPS O-acetylase OafA/YrhL
MTSPSPAHHPELDALRGLAAASVVFYHLSSLAPAMPLLSINPLVRGHESVMLFFVLSGFVLSLPFHAGRDVPYGPFVLRRLCRVYLPYMAAVLLAVAACLTVPHTYPSGAFGWLGAVWYQPLTWPLVLGHLSLIGPFDTFPLNPVVWSLVHEMRLSLVFPLVVLLSRRLPGWALAIAGPLLSWGVTALGAQCSSGPDLRASLLGTLYYAGFFVAGAWLARHHEALVARFRGLALPLQPALTALALGVYLYANMTVHLLHGPMWLVDWLVGPAAMGLIVASLASNRLSRLLRTAVPQYLGRISYSLYLFHPLVVLATMYMLHTRLSLGAIALLDLPLSLLAAHLGYRLVEAPAIALGRTLSRRLSGVPRPERQAA